MPRGYGIAPGLDGLIAAQQQGREQDTAALQQGVGLMGLLQAAQKQQQAAQYRSALSGATTPEEQAAIAARFAGPDTVMRTAQGALDRKATLDAANVNAASMREQRMHELQIRGQQRADEIEQRAREGRITQEQAARDRAALQENMARLAASLRQAPQPHALQLTTDDAGNQLIVNPDGTTRPLAGADGKPVQARPPAAVLKERQAKAKLNSELSSIIPTLETISKDGGLIDQSTGSGFGAAVDYAAGFVGKATPGSVAVGKLKPMIDPILKLVPRFEGPQSDKDTASYREAAGDLANPNTPNETKKAAAKQILEIFKKRRDQFTTPEYDAAAADSGASPYAGPERRAPAGLPDQSAIDAEIARRGLK